MKNKLTKSNHGFTIIEVMIVLAIAGLILLIVFLAIPSLQRNSRNTQRKSDSAKLASLISEYESNNNGSVPTSIGSGTGATNLDITSEKWSIITTPSQTSISDYSGTPTAPAADAVIVYKKATCNGTTPTTAVSNRSVVVWYGLEGKTTTGCVEAGS